VGGLVDRQTGIAWGHRGWKRHPVGVDQVRDPPGNRVQLLDVGTVPPFIRTLVFLGFGIFPTPYFPEWGALTALSVGPCAVRSVTAAVAYP